MQHEVCTCQQTHASAALVLCYFLDEGVKENMQDVHSNPAASPAAEAIRESWNRGMFQMFVSLPDPLVWLGAAHDKCVIEPFAIDARPHCQAHGTCDRYFWFAFTLLVLYTSSRSQNLYDMIAFSILAMLS
jgi:hypothetical protein